MIYFLLTIRYGWKPEDFEKTHTEKIMHALAAGVPIISGIILAIIGYINPTPYALGRCYIQAFPPNCDVTNDGQCQRGQHARIVRWTLALGPYIICYIFLLFSVFFIAWTVHRQARTMSRYNVTNAVSIERRVILQSLLYGSVFFMTYFWGLFMMVSHLAPVKDESSIRSWLYPIQMLREIFYPLQGFCNLMIYLNGQRSPSNRGRIFMFPRIADRLRDMTTIVSKSAKSAFRSTSEFFSMESGDIIDLDVDDLDVESDSDIEEGGGDGFEGNSSHNTKSSDGTEETTLSCSGTTTHQVEVIHQSKDEDADNSTTSTTTLGISTR